MELRDVFCDVAVPVDFVHGAAADRPSLFDDTEVFEVVDVVVDGRAVQAGEVRDIGDVHVDVTLAEQRRDDFRFRRFSEELC